MKIQVTQDDILAGQPGVANHCALSLAIIRATGKPAVVFHTCCYLGRTRYSLPDDAFAALKQFDAKDMNNPLQPFEFELPV